MLPACARLLLLLLLAVPGVAATAPDPAERERATALAAEAKLILDAHFGMRSRLDQARLLLEEALSLDTENAAVYLQAARLVTKGGTLSMINRHGSNRDNYGMLLDRTLALAPNDPKALILKAEYFFQMRQFYPEREMLEKAKATGTQDPWLHMGFGRHFRQMGDAASAMAHFSKLKDRGPGESTEHRNAYIGALVELGRYAVELEEFDELIRLKNLIVAHRDPEDVRSLCDIAASLMHAALFDEAIPLARESLVAEENHQAEMVLAASLYGKAAELHVAGDAAGAAPLVNEAKSIGVDRNSILHYLAANGHRSALIASDVYELMEQ